MRGTQVRTYHLPRLARPFYQADAYVHWTLTVQNRATGWLSNSFHGIWRELLLHCAAREGLVCPSYCIMPDHIHLLWMGLRPDSDQRNGMAFLRTHVEPRLAPLKFQSQAHDHVLRPIERTLDSLRTTIAYVLLNPVRKGWVRQPQEWPCQGCVVAGYPRLHPLEDRFLEIFWKLYTAQRDPRCDSHCLPPFP